MTSHKALAALARLHQLPAISEADWQDQVIHVAHLNGWRVAHFRPGRTANGWRTPVAADAAGWPDLVLVRERIIYAELKSDRGRLTVAERDWLENLTAAGAETYVWRPGQLDDVLAVLRRP